MRVVGVVEETGSSGPIVADTSPPTVTRPPAMEIGSDGSVCAPAVPARQTSSIDDNAAARARGGHLYDRIIVRGVSASRRRSQGARR